MTNFTAGASGFVGETDKGGAVDNKGGTITATGDAFPLVTAPAQYTIPLRTPFALTGSATDADGDALTYSWEQNDRGGAAGTAVMSNTKTNGPLFAMFPKSGQISASDTLLYNSPGENHLTNSPTRVFPDLQQILDNNTNADTGACTTGPIAPPVPVPVNECFAEFLPTADYVGFAGTNAVPLSLHFRLTARDGRGGVNSGDTTVLLASGTGPFRVTAPNTAGAWAAGSTQTVTWDVAGTNAAPVNTTDVKISLSVDGGHTYPFVLAGSTANDGSEAVVVPNTVSTDARVKVEALGNVYFDVSNADFTVWMPGVIGLDSVTFKGLIDSFDSAVGPYGGTNVGSAANLFSNLDVLLSGGNREGRHPVRTGRSHRAEGRGRHRRRPGRDDDHEQRHDQRDGDAELADADDQPAERGAVLAVHGHCRHQRRPVQLQRREGRPDRRRRQERDARRRHVLLPRPDALGWVEDERATVP